MVDYERTFDNAAMYYDKSRPMYLKEWYDDIFKYKTIEFTLRGAILFCL